MGISHCPAPTMLGGSEILDIPGMRKAGIPLGLGVDGCATNDGSNMLDTLRLAYLMQTFLSKQRGGCPSPYDMLKLATAGGADMIGRPELGRLAGVPTPITDAHVTLSEAMMGRNYHAEGVNLEKMGLEGKTIEQVLDYVTRG
mgnify:CR=1 FL=1